MYFTWWGHSWWVFSTIFDWCDFFAGCWRRRGFAWCCCTFAGANYELPGVITVCIQKKTNSNNFSNKTFKSHLLSSLAFNAKVSLYEQNLVYSNLLYLSLDHTTYWYIFFSFLSKYITTSMAVGVYQFPILAPVCIIMLFDIIHTQSGD